MYQWLLRRNGFKVSDTGYWFYANATKDREAFDGRLDFELTLVPYKGDDSWVEETLLEIKTCLESDMLPDASVDCDYCLYREAVGKKMPAFAKNKPASSESDDAVGTLGL